MKQVLIIAGALVLIAGGMASPASAQRRYHSPYGPTITPYLNYFRRDNGVLGDPYNAWIRPQRRLRYELNQQDQSLSYLGRSLQNVDRDVNRLRMYRESGAAPTGTGGGFMNYSHYYQMPGRGRPQR